MSIVYSPKSGGYFDIGAKLNIKPGQAIFMDTLEGSVIVKHDDENKRLREKVQRQRRELRRLNKTLKAMWEGVRLSASVEVIETTRYLRADLTCVECAKQNSWSECPNATDSGFVEDDNPACMAFSPKAQP